LTGNSILTLLRSLRSVSRGAIREHRGANGALCYRVVITWKNAV